MVSGHGRAILSLILHLTIAAQVSPTTAGRASVIQLPRGGTYCEGWKFAAETNSVGFWVTTPIECKDFVANYVKSGQYDEDYQVVVNHAIDFAKTIKIVGDGKDAWVFDIDETLLSNTLFYMAHRYGGEPLDERAMDVLVGAGEAKPLAAGQRLYNELKKHSFTIILLTGRNELLRDVTVNTLLNVGYSGWDQLIFRSPNDRKKSSREYKSEKRAELKKKGYRIHGNVGDQWSDLLGYPEAKRSFKAPNPMYYIP